MAQVTGDDILGEGPDIRVGATESAALHNLTSGAGVIYDVYPTYQELVERCPIEHGTVHQYFENPAGWNYEAFFPTADDVVTAHGYDQVQEVFRRSSSLSSQAFGAVPAGERVGIGIIGMDEPDHRRMRILLQPAFSKLAMETWKGDIIQPIVDGHLERIRPLGRADLYHEIAPNVPIQTIAVGLGLPPEDQRRFFEWAVRMTSGTDQLANALALSDYIEPLVAERRASPGTDLISILTQADIQAVQAEGVTDTRPLDDSEINGFVRLLIIAGAGTTYKAYGNLMFMLLTHPDVLDTVRADRSLVPQAIEEALRIESPIAIIRRRAAEDLEIDGVEIKAECPVIVNIAAANHDPAQWGDDADEYDIYRDRADRHMTFGFGIHRCLGIHLARAELNVLCNRTLDLLPNVRLDPDSPAPRITGLGMRLPTAIPAVWDV